MRIILLTALLFGFARSGFSQVMDDDNVTLDYFYGTWTDTLKTGMTLTKEKKLLLYPMRKKNEGVESLDLSTFNWTYKLLLDKRPILIEIACDQCDGSQLPKFMRGQIEIVNPRQIYFTTLTTNGDIKDRILMTKE